jgi:hypothetical protein
MKNKRTAEQICELLEKTHEDTEAYLIALLRMSGNAAAIAVKASENGFVWTILLDGQTGKQFAGQGATLEEAATALLTE